LHNADSGNGQGAWAILVWTFVTSLSPLRSLAHEIFVLQHIAAAAVFLWLLWVHVPSYANYNVWFAIGAISFDWVLRLLLAVYRNVRIRVRRRNSCNSKQFIGHQIDLRAVGSDITVVTIKDVHMLWKAGQHLYLWIPRLGLLESHPFTIATPCISSKGCHCNEIQLAIKTQAGFSRKINRFAVMTQGTSKSLTGFIAGPYGVPPKWEAYETLILISASTGASFTLPILESILDNPATICTQRIELLLIVRERGHIDYYAKRIFNALARTEAIGISLDVEIAVTSGEQTMPLLDSKSILYSYGRPDIASFIRRPVEITGGETSIAVCGGKSLVATVRNSVASLSDERAVHKGSGAQGIYLHVEEYCF
jgi:NAD(P)H-flavin reductase